MQSKRIDQTGERKVMVAVIGVLMIAGGVLVGISSLFA